MKIIITRVRKTSRGAHLQERGIFQSFHSQLESWNLSKDDFELRDLIRQANAGDMAARERVYRRFRRKLRKMAGQPKYSGPAFEDRYGAAIVGFFEALPGYDPAAERKFFTWASEFIHGRIVKCVHDSHQQGGKDESRAARKHRTKPIIVSLKRPWCNKWQEARNALNEELELISDWSCFNPLQLTPHLCHFEPTSGAVDEAAIAQDLRAMRRLAEIGRQQYALELAAKNSTIVPLFEPTTKEYSIPVNTHDTAEPPSDQKEALEPRPLVWDQRDRFGRWRRMPDEIDLRTNAHGRMASLRRRTGKEGTTHERRHQHDHALRPGRDLHRTDGIDHRDIRQVGRAAE